MTLPVLAIVGIALAWSIWPRRNVTAVQRTQAAVPGKVFILPIRNDGTNLVENVLHFTRSDRGGKDGEDNTTPPSAEIVSARAFRARHSRRSTGQTRRTAVPVTR